MTIGKTIIKCMLALTLVIGFVLVSTALTVTVYNFIFTRAPDKICKEAGYKEATHYEREVFGFLGKVTEVSCKGKRRNIREINGTEIYEVVDNYE